MHNFRDNLTVQSKGGQRRAKEGFNLSDEFVIAVLLWVDDVLSIAEGEDEQVKFRK